MLSGCPTAPCRLLAGHPIAALPYPTTPGAGAPLPPHQRQTQLLLRRDLSRLLPVVPRPQPPNGSSTPLRAPSRAVWAVARTAAARSKQVRSTDLTPQADKSTPPPTAVLGVPRPLSSLASVVAVAVADCCSPSEVSKRAEGAPQPRRLSCKKQTTQLRRPSKAVRLRKDQLLTRLVARVDRCRPTGVMVGQLRKSLH